MSFILWLGLLSCKKENLPATFPFKDDFSRTQPGITWKSSSKNWRVENGWLCVSQAYNKCLWLQGRLPDETVIEMDARTETPDGDIKFVAYGDGEKYDSGYSFIFGGWKNTLSIISRKGEHTPDRLEKTENIKKGKVYHFKVIKRGKHVRWFIDGNPYLDFYDSEPLRGKGHDRFAFCNWESKLRFDNLKIKEAVGIEPEEKPFVR